MRTKLFFIFSIALILTINTNAQLKWGIRGGVTSSNVKLTNSTDANYVIEYNKGNYGWHAGLIGQVKVINFFVQPELLFSTSKFDLSYKDKSYPSNNQLGEQKIRKLDLPVMIGFKLAVFKLQAGPVASLVLSSQSDLLDDKDIDQNLKQATIGFQAGIGLELSALLIDFKYEGNLSKLGDGMTIKNTDVKFDQRMRQFVFSIGYLF